MKNHAPWKQNGFKTIFLLQELGFHRNAPFAFARAAGAAASVGAP